jgi:hypothetical protein
MERRRIKIDDEAGQRELPFAPVRRRISDGPEHAALTKVAAPGTKAPAAPATQELILDRNEFLFGMTDYSRGQPPSSGYWEVKQHSARAPDGHNWWYSAAINKWHRGVPQTDSRLAGFIPHAQFILSHEWRGLKKPWPEASAGMDQPLAGQPYPYDLEQRPFGQPYYAGDAVTMVHVVGKMEVTQAGVSPVDLNPRRRIKA